MDTQGHLKGRPSLAWTLAAGGRKRFSIGAACVAAALFAPAQDAMALWGDRLELFAAQRITHEDNIFRTSTGKESDTYYTTSLGFNLDVPVSRQRILAGAAVHSARYDRFGVLNHTGNEARAIWLWEVGNRLNGRLGHTRSEALGTFVNFAGRTPNLLDIEQTFLNGRFMLTPRWRLQAGYTEGQQRNSAAVRQVNDVDTETVDAGVSYVTPAGNSIGLSIRDEDGHLPNPQLVGATFIDNSYNQESIGLMAEWALTGQSRLNARADRVDRRYAQVPARNFEGNTFRAVYDWTPGGRFSLNAVAQRDISASEDIQTSLVLVKGIALRPSYSLTDKTTLSGVLDYSHRDYLADPGIPLATASGRSDRVTIAGITIAYRPLRTVTLLGTYQHEDRSSNVAAGDFNANVISVSARIGF